jgi:glyoxylase-like metal-dependent hydrolase (beta-lactamase superfamily II)
MSNTPLLAEPGCGITCIDAAYVVPGLACFYLLQRAGEYALVETGTAYSLENLDYVLNARGIAPESIIYVIPTHVHLDHAAGAGAMMRRFPHATLLVHPRGARHLVNPERLVAAATAVYGEARFSELYGRIEAVAADRVREMADGEVLTLGDTRLEFRHMRGHANHHFCIWDETSSGWFTGDTFGISYPWFRFDGGAYIIPATAPNQFDPVALMESVEILRSYSPDRLYLTHWGELSFTDGAVQLLLDQVEYYVELGREAGGDTALLKNNILNYSLSLVEAQGGSVNEEQLGILNDFDADLNAQGVLDYLARQQG